MVKKKEVNLKCGTWRKHGKGQKEKLIIIIRGDV